MEKLILSKKRLNELKTVLSCKCEDDFFFTLPLKLKDRRLLYYLCHIKGYNIYLWFKPCKFYYSYGFYVYRAKETCEDFDLFGFPLCESRYIFINNLFDSFISCVDDFLNNYVDCENIA